jgi:hypothetical protein
MDFEKYGIVGVLIAGIAWLSVFIKNMMKEHREERADWQKRQEQQNDEHNRSLNKNTEVLSELTTLIKSMKK